MEENEKIVTEEQPKEEEMPQCQDKETLSPIVERFGTCAYCGQGKMIKAPEDKAQIEIDALVTEECNCIDARAVRNKRERKEKIDDFINSHFAEDIRPFIQDSVDIIDRWDSQINDISIKLIDDFAVKIWKDSDDKLHIRTKMVADDELKV